MKNKDSAETLMTEAHRKKGGSKLPRSKAPG